MSAHDAMVRTFADTLSGLLRDSGAYSVLTNARWQSLAAFLERVYEFSVLLCSETGVLCRDETRNCFGPELRPHTAFLVFQKEKYDFDWFFDVVDDLAAARVAEIVLWDPTGECMVPTLDAWRLSQGVYRRARTASRGVFFSTAGFCLDTRAGGPTVRAAGDPRIEEELFACEHHLSVARVRASAETATVDGLTAKVNRLRAQLGRSAQ